MTSQKVMLALAIGMLMLTGCNLPKKAADRTDNLASPYTTRRLLAVAPLVNQSGALGADGLRMADLITGRIDSIANLDALPVNRVLAAMAALKIDRVSNLHQAQQIIRMLGVDGLIVGVITAWDPYDPPKIGMAIELYTDDRVERDELINISRLVSAATGDAAGQAPADTSQIHQPINQVSAYLNASDPWVREEIEQYGAGRGPENTNAAADWRRYRTNMNLFSEYVSHAMFRRLLHAETVRLTAERQKLLPPS